MQIKIIGKQHDRIFIGINPPLFILQVGDYISLDVGIDLKFPSEEIESITYEGYNKTWLYDSEAMLMFKALKISNPEIKIEAYKPPKIVL